MPVLFSNLAITGQARDEIRVFSFPADRIGEPKISEIATTLGSGDTRFWSVRNLNAIPAEPYAPPFEELSMMTAFVSDLAFRGSTDWSSLAKTYWEENLDKGHVKDSRIRQLGLAPLGSPVTFARVDSLYTALRHAIVLDPVNSLYPLVDDLDKVFDDGSGDASDLSAIFYKILRQWEVDAKAGWIRDRRKGVYETSVPTVRWFDRIGVQVRIGGVERLYDFDRAIPNRYSTPWFLKGITAMVISNDGCQSVTTPAARAGEAWIRESHDLRFSDRFAVLDSMATSGRGAPVEEWRNGGYALKGKDLESFFERAVLGKCLENAGDLRYSPFFEEGLVSIAAKGTSRAAVTTIEKYVSVRPANHLLRQLRDELFAPSRTNDVVFPEPYTMTIEWRIHHPEGYVVTESPRDTTMRGFAGGRGSIACKRDGDDVRLTATLDLTSQVIPPEDYNKLVQLLMELETASERAVTFRKK
ncbi:MAG: DUF3858 domain-containing protein [Bacteroidota bacterium]